MVSTRFQKCTGIWLTHVHCADRDSGTPFFREPLLLLITAMWLALVLSGCGTVDSTDDSVLVETTEETTTTAEEVVDLFPVTIGKKWGYIDRTGQLTIEARFSGADPFSDGLGCVCEGDSRQGYVFGFIDPTGSYVLPARYKVITRFSEGLAPMSEGDLWGYIDKTGQFVLPPEHEGTGLFSEGLAAVGTRDGWGYIDRTGRFTIEPQYLSASGFKEGLAVVGTPDGPVYIDKTGQIVIGPQFVDPGHFGDGLAPVSRDSQALPLGEWGYIDRTGQLVIPYQFMQALIFSSGLAPVLLAPDASKDDADGWYFIDTTGSVVMGPFLVASPFYGGLASVITLDGKNAYLDTSGRVVWSAPNVWLEDNAELDG